MLTARALALIALGVAACGKPSSLLDDDHTPTAAGSAANDPWAAVNITQADGSPVTVIAELGTT